MSNISKSGLAKSKEPVRVGEGVPSSVSEISRPSARRLQDMMERRVNQTLEERPNRDMQELLGLDTAHSPTSVSAPVAMSTTVTTVDEPMSPGIGVGIQEGPRLMIREIPINAIIPSPHQPRIYVNEIEHDQLTVSIREHGLLQPIKVRPTENGQYMLIFGERRWRATKASGRSTIEALVEDVPDAAAAAQTMIENVQRADLAPLDIARGYQSLLDYFKTTIEDLAQRLGVSASQIKHAVRILHLPIAILEKVLDPAVGLKISHAEELLALKDSPVRLEAIADRLVKEKWTQEQLRAEIQRKPRVNRGYQPVQFEDRGGKGFHLTIRLQSNRPQDFLEIKTRLKDALARVEAYEVV